MSGNNSSTTEVPATIEKTDQFVDWRDDKLAQILLPIVVFILLTLIVFSFVCGRKRRQKEYKQLQADLLERVRAKKPSIQSKPESPEGQMVWSAYSSSPLHSTNIQSQLQPRRIDASDNYTPGYVKRQRSPLQSPRKVCVVSETIQNGGLSNHQLSSSPRNSSPGYTRLIPKPQGHAAQNGGYSSELEDLEKAIVGTSPIAIMTPKEAQLTARTSGRLIGPTVEVSGASPANPRTALAS